MGLLDMFRSQPTTQFKLHGDDPSEYSGDPAPGDRYNRIRYSIGLERWPPAIWKLAALADNFILGEKGIRPKFSYTAADEAWDDYLIDPAQELNPRDFLRIVAASLTIDNEVFIHEVDGHFVPLPPPSRIVYNDAGLPRQYIYSNPARICCPYNAPRETGINFEDGVTRHYLVRWFPGQRRGVSLQFSMRGLLNDRRDFIKAIIKLAKMAARLALVHKRMGGNPLIDAQTSEVKDKVQVVNFEEDGLLEIGPQDTLDTIGVSGGPINPMDMDRLVMGTVGQRAGLSRMSVMGDFSDTSYSSARFANINDQATWMRYQEIILRIVRLLYSEWPLLAKYGDMFTGWYRPPVLQIDPTKATAVNRMLVQMKAKSIQEVIVEDGRDPETVFEEIEEFEKRFGPTEEKASSGTPPSS